MSTKLMIMSSGEASGNNPLHGPLWMREDATSHQQQSTSLWSQHSLKTPCLQMVLSSNTVAQMRGLLNKM